MKTIKTAGAVNKLDATVHYSVLTATVDSTDNIINAILGKTKLLNKFLIYT